MKPDRSIIIILFFKALFCRGICLFAAEILDIDLFLYQLLKNILRIVLFPYQLLKNILRRGRSSNCAAASCSRLPARAERQQEYQRQCGAYGSFHIRFLLFYCRSFQLVSASSIADSSCASTTPSCV